MRPVCAEPGRLFLYGYPTPFATLLLPHDYALSYATAFPYASWLDKYVIPTPWCTNGTLLRFAPHMPQDLVGSYGTLTTGLLGLDGYYLG